MLFRSLLVKIMSDHFCMVAERAGKLVGMIGAIVAPHFFNPAIQTLTELFWWVIPEARGGRAGLMLLQSLVDFGKANVDWIVCTLELDSPVNPECLNRRGFKLHERAFLLEVC